MERSSDRIRRFWERRQWNVCRVSCRAFIERPEDVEKGLDFDRRLYVVRRVFEQSNDDTYVVSLSSRTIVYKGMFLVGQLRTVL